MDRYEYTMNVLEFLDSSGTVHNDVFHSDSGRLEVLVFLKPVDLISCTNAPSSFVHFNPHVEASQVS